ncbi:leucine-rich repeat domain-containing protein [Paenibacillus hemerocallicola]|uniref:Leucine-rich repeat domain-containing protein n=1 Tax=Paenibacillus hemerocallicola TaxID=1172614 RepID=A0A5C4T1D1_9BACL|nr:leucine-rich repeat domain-containing protein [Paenibacillus hemerocallicola]TNJ62047.1 leucine-rich repeat domain-containing protein [Paenibacillus hemerocallicola]
MRKIKIWLLVASEKSMRIELESYEQDGDRIRSYYKEEGHLWEPLKVVTKRKGNKSDYIDFMMGFPVLTVRAKKVLTPLIGSDVEFLPLLHEEHELFAVKVNRVQNFVDMTNPMERKIGYGFFSEFVHICAEKIEPEVHMFRLPQHLTTRIYVTDDFKDAVEAHKLKTFQFIKLWDTENSEEARKERLKRFDPYYKRLATRDKVSYQNAMDLLSLSKFVRESNSILKKENGSLVIGEIFDDETVRWIDPMYIPPLFFERQWYVYENSESELVVQEYFAELSHEVNGPKGNIIIFKDKNLERMVRAHLKLFKDNLTDINMLKLRHIFPKYDDGLVASLSGMEYAKNLLEFMISNNSEFDENELKHLPDSLHSLAVIKCGLTNIEIMYDLKLPNLSSICFSDNSLTDLLPLTFIPSLTRIDVVNNQIEDILPLNRLSELDCVILRNNPVKNIHELHLPKLRYLYIDGIQTEDWRFLLSGFPKLEYLSISHEGMTDISRKSMEDIIKSKKFVVSWTQPDGLAKLFNDSNRKR